jgi:hypothetical protein
MKNYDSYSQISINSSPSEILQCNSLGASGYSSSSIASNADVDSVKNKKKKREICNEYFKNLITYELVRKNLSSGFGFDLRGDRPAIIGAVRKGSIAEKAGVEGIFLIDVFKHLLKINNIFESDLLQSFNFTI